MADSMRSVPQQFFIDMDSYLRQIDSFGDSGGKAVVAGIRRLGALWLTRGRKEAEPEAAPAQGHRAVDCEHEEGCCSSTCAQTRRCVDRPAGVPAASQCCEGTKTCSHDCAWGRGFNAGRSNGVAIPLKEQ